MSFQVALILLGSIFLVQQNSAADELSRAVLRARKAGIDSAFVSKISKANGAGFVPRAVRINLTNYASTPDYRSHYNRKSVKKVKAFVKKYKKQLKAVQKQTGVSKEVIASILWIESKCGEVIGTYHVPSVFLSLMLTKDSAYIEQGLTRVAEEQKLDSTEFDSVRALLIRRAEKKINWAIGELKALAEIDKKRIMDVPTLKGSWAGAFGFPQFIPTSYLRWASDGDADGDVDLYSVPDAIKSVGIYLKSNGWGPKKTSQVKAVHHYNNSDAYVNAVFTLARKLR